MSLFPPHTLCKWLFHLPFLIIATIKKQCMHKHPVFNCIYNWCLDNPSLQFLLIEEKLFKSRFHVNENLSKLIFPKCHPADRLTCQRTRCIFIRKTHDKLRYYRNSLLMLTVLFSVEKKRKRIHF